MKITKVYSVTTNDTRAIRQMAKDEGIKLSRCKLGSNRYHIIVDTKDWKDRYAIAKILNGTKYQLAPIWQDSFSLQTLHIGSGGIMIQRIA